MNIILIGGRGVGKTTLASILGKKLNQTVYSTDELIEDASQKTIPELVEQEGWQVFREYEYRICCKLGELDEVIIDAGGGIMVDLDEDGNEIWSERKMEALKKNGVVFLLTTSIEDQMKNIESGHYRPSLTGTNSPTGELAEVMERRKEFYERAADHVISTENKNLDDCAEEVIQKL